MLYGIKTIQTDAQTLMFDNEGRLQAKDVSLTLIPYYSWAHRGSGNMDVWMAQDLNATTPGKAPTLASTSKVDASVRSASMGSVNDRLVPKDGNDRSIPYIHWWPKKNTTEWLTYTFKQPSTVKSCTVYWFDDQPWGGCRIPDSWNIQYKDKDGNWTKVTGASDYPTVKGSPCTVSFDAVTTSALKLEIVQPKDFSTGVFEWEVK
jgi:hypothetical protein